MFRVSANRLRSWWSAATEDILGGDLEVVEPTLDYFRNHPHRQPLRSPRERRLGAVVARPAHCISPVRASAEIRRTQLSR